MLQVTPNGPWGKDVHPNLPASLDEILAELQDCFRAGATGVHLHVRDESGAETLDPAVVNETCRQVRDLAAEAGVAAEIGLPYFLKGEPSAVAQRLNDALDAAGSVCPRLTHGMGDWTWPLVADAFRRGHDTRVGFEDSVFLPDGATARSNAQLVEAAVALRRSI